MGVFPRVHVNQQWTPGLPCGAGRAKHPRRAIHQSTNALDHGVVMYRQQSVDSALADSAFGHCHACPFLALILAWNTTGLPQLASLCAPTGRAGGVLAFCLADRCHFGPSFCVTSPQTQTLTVFPPAALPSLPRGKPSTSSPADILVREPTQAFRIHQFSGTP
jgi:hypothetical protein